MLSFTCQRRAGKVSLSTKERVASEPISVRSPKRKPRRMPCFTQTFACHWFPRFSAARIFPREREERNSRNISCAEESAFACAPRAQSRSISFCKGSIAAEYTRHGAYSSSVAGLVYVHVCSCLEGSRQFLNIAGSYLALLTCL